MELTEPLEAAVVAVGIDESPPTRCVPEKVVVPPERAEGHGELERLDDGRITL
jgi:hypothetical protein